MKLSIITINYNNSAGLAKTIRSVVSQTCKYFEYIVVDGDSTDGSVDVIKKHADKINHWVSEPDGGIYNAMNKGVRMAHGEYVMFLNSGDVLYDDGVIEKVLTQLRADICVGDLAGEEGGVMKAPMEDEVTMSYLMRGSLSHPSSFTRRELLLKHPFREDTKILGDWEFFMYALVHLNASYQRLDGIISVFDAGGISSTQQLPEKDRKILEETETEILQPRVRADYDVFMGKKDDYHRLFFELSFSRHRKWVYRLVVAVLKIITLNHGFIRDFKL